MISIIIPNYNSRETIKNTIDSILSQTYKDLEVIVVDDGSTDGSLELLDSRCPIVKTIEQGHLGANVARNRGASEARGEYLFFCDSDISLKKDALEKLLKTLEKSRLKSGKYNNLEESRLKSGKYNYLEKSRQSSSGYNNYLPGFSQQISYAYCSFKIGWKKFKSREFDGEELKSRNYISTMSLVMAKDFPGFDERIARFQDWDLWLTMLEQGKRGIWVDEILFTATPAKNGKSKWFPRVFYKIPWAKLGIKIKALERYKEALEIIKKKHKLK